MGRTKGSKNKHKEPKERFLEGYFILDSGIKIPFDVCENDVGDSIFELYDSKFPFEKGDTIYLGDFFILADRVAGFYANEYEE